MEKGKEKEKEKNYSLEKKESKRLKGISKFIYVVTKICEVCVTVGLVCLILAMLVVPVLSSNVKVNFKEDSGITSGTIKVLDQKITYERSETLVTINDGDNKNGFEIVSNPKDVDAFNKALAYLEKGDYTTAIMFVEFELLIIAIILVIEILILKKVYHFFKNIRNEETPFSKENIELLEKFGKLLIYAFVISLVSKIINSIILNNSMNINLTDIMEILFVYFLLYIFKYGYKLQKETKGKIYSEQE